MPKSKKPRAKSARKAMNLYGWIAGRLKVISKAGKLEPLIPNEVQVRLYGHMTAQRAAGQPVRLIVLKARREGISTGIEALMFAKVYHEPFRKAWVSAHSEPASHSLFTMNKLFEQELPPQERRQKEYSNRKEIVFSAPHRSRFTVATAGDELGRSEEIHYLHCSEVAFWEHAASALNSVLQAVSDDPETMIVLESTANGASGEFYERWNAAVRQQRERPGSRDGFYPVFISWLECPEYARPLAVGESTEPVDDEERRLVRLGATPEQLAWRRIALGEKCNGDEDLFKQEYPATPEEAFTTSGRPAIPPAVVAHHEQMIRPPARRVRLVRVDGGIVAEDVGPEAQYAWEVWYEPVEHGEYTAFGDVAEGALSDPADGRSEPDSCAGAVLNRRELRYDAVWVGQVAPEWFGEELLKAAEWYNAAWATPEANAAGMAALVPFKEAAYPNLYQRVKAVDRLDAGDDTPLWGWKTTTANRDYMIDCWIAACRENPGTGYEGQIRLYSARLVDEERSFVRKPNGKREHQVGSHDDLLFAAMGAFQLHLTCPRKVVSWEDLHQRRPVSDWRRQGGVDPGVVAEEAEVGMTTG